MIAADTNVWARAYLNDDAEQSVIARTAIADACNGHGVFIPLIVLAELYWVLRTRWNKDRVLQAMEHLLATDGVIVEASPLVRLAITEARSNAVGLADILIAEVSIAAGAQEVITFDKAMARRTMVRYLG